MKTAIIACLFGLMGISGFTSALAQETADQGQTITGHAIVENWSGSEDFHLVSFSTSESVPGDEFLAFVSKDILDDDVTVAALFWHDDNPSGEDALDRVLAQARLVVPEDGYLIVPYRPHGSSYGHWRMEDEFDLQRAFVEYLYDIGVDQFNFYGHGGGGQIALILAGELPHLVRTIGLASPYELCPYDFARSPLERIAELPDVPILIVHDRPDDSARLRDIEGYFRAVERAGLQVRMVVKGATTDDSARLRDTEDYFRAVGRAGLLVGFVVKGATLRPCWAGSCISIYRYTSPIGSLVMGLSAPRSWISYRTLWISLVTTPGNAWALLPPELMCSLGMMQSG